MCSGTEEDFIISGLKMFGMVALRLKTLIPNAQEPPRQPCASLIEAYINSGSKYPEYHLQD